MVAIRLVCAPFGVGLLVHQKYVWSNSILLCSQVLRIVSLLVLINGLGPRVLYVVLANAPAEGGSLIATQLLSRRLLPSLRFSRSNIDRSVARQLLSFGGWHFVAQLGATLRQSADVILLNKLATPVDVTSFDLGSMPDRTLRQTIMEATNPVLPALTALHAANAPERMRNAILKTGRYSMFLSLAVAMPLFIFSSEFYQLYLGHRYSAYSAAATVCLILMATYPVFYSTNAVFKIAYATGHVRGIAILTILSQIVNVALSVFFIHHLHLGAVGAALGTVVTDCALQFGFPSLFILLHITKLSLRTWFMELLVIGILPAAVGSLVWFSCKLVFAPDTWPTLIACGVVGGAAYVSALIRFGLTPAERKQVRELFIVLSARLRGEKASLDLCLAAKHSTKLE
jgi:O-antigen/teichoic acid export membrane protein